MPMLTAQINTLTAQLVTLLGITDEDFLKASIPLVAEAINSYTHRCLYKASYVERFRSVPRMRDVIFTRQFPILTMTAVTEDAVALAINTDYEATLEDGMLRRMAGTAPGNWKGNAVISISYDAGYDPYPPDLVTVLAGIVEHEYAKKAARDLSAANGGLDGINKVTIFDVGSIEMTNAGAWQSDAEDVHPVLGNYTIVLDEYRNPIATGTRAPYEAARLT